MYVEKWGFFCFLLGLLGGGKKDNGDSAVRKLNSTKKYDSCYMKFGFKVTRVCTPAPSERLETPDLKCWGLCASDHHL